MRLKHFTCRTMGHFTGFPWPQAIWTNLARGERLRHGVKSGYYRSLLLHSHVWVHITSFLSLIKPAVAIKKPVQLQQLLQRLYFNLIFIKKVWGGSAAAGQLIKSYKRVTLNGPRLWDRNKFTLWICILLSYECNPGASLTPTGLLWQVA